MNQVIASFQGLIYLALAIGITFIAVTLWRRHSSHPGAILTGGCAIIMWFPGMFLAVGISMSQWNHVSDADLFKQVLGFESGLDEANMMFDDHGDISDGEVFMTASDYSSTKLPPKMRKIRGLQHTDMSLQTFDALGKKAGLTWWHNLSCPNPALFEMRNFRQWRKVYLLSCDDWQGMSGIFLR